MRRWIRFFVVMGLAFSVGCTFNAKKEFSFYNHSSSEPVIWPPAPQEGKIKYLGELVGEQNILRSGPSSFMASSQRVLKKLVGLGRSTSQQVILQRPQSGVVDAAGNIFVSDVSRQAIFKFSPENKTLDVWEFAEKDRRFVSPIGVVVDDAGDLWVADSALGIIAHLDADGEPLASIGGEVLTRPTGLVLDKENKRLFVADTGEHDIKVLDFSGKIMKTMGERGEKLGALNGPTHLAYEAGKLYVSDTLNARVQIFSKDGEFLDSIGQRGLHVGNMTRPKGVAVDSDENVYVVESYYDYLLIFDSQGNFLLPIGGTGQEIGHFYLPAGIWTDNQNRIFIADMFNGRVVVFERLE